MTGTSPHVLFIGGTGTISAPAVRLAAERGMSVSVLNRGNNARRRALPESVTSLVGDIREPESVRRAIAGRRFDAVLNFLSYSAEDALQSVELFGPVTDQYIHISTASIYHKPILQVPLVESTPRHNPFLRYARDKIAAENALMGAFEDRGFPVTIVRPSHTYDEANPPLPGGWTAVDRMAQGKEIAVHGDGTSLWTLTHAADFAVALVGLTANPRAVGEVFHITSNDVYTWDQIYTVLAHALGVEPRLVHVPAEFFPLAAPDWAWSELVVGDLSHSAVFDTSKIRRFVPDFRPVITFHRSALELAGWREAHPEESRPDPAVDDAITRLVEGHHRARDLFRSLAPGQS